MNIYNAIMKAADSVEHSGKYQFDSWSVSRCGSPMCMLGWIGFHAGLKNDALNCDVAEKVLGLEDTGVFYGRVKRLIGNSAYVDSPVDAAKGMRLYADEYHGHEKLNPAAPDWNAIANGHTAVKEGSIPQELTW